MRNTNAFLSAMNLIPLCSRIELCFTRELPCAVGISTEIGMQILVNHECAEIFIDSTYKANNSKFKLFLIMASVLGTGTPLAYMLLQPGTQNDIDSRHERIRCRGILQSCEGKIFLT